MSQHTTNLPLVSCLLVRNSATLQAPCTSLFVTFRRRLRRRCFGRRCWIDAFFNVQPVQGFVVLVLPSSTRGSYFAGLST